MTKLINPFYTTALLWLVIFGFYYFGWSDLCMDLDIQLVLFLSILILTLFLAGFILSRKRLGEFLESGNTVYGFRSETLFLTILSVVVMTAGMLYQKTIPLLNLSQGFAYNAVDTGIPFIGTFTTSFALFLSFRLSDLFCSTRKKEYALEWLTIMLCFVLLVARQNIVICLLGIVAAELNERFNAKQKHAVPVFRIGICCVLLLVIGAFAFGAVGNMRYGLWEWSDSSMICAVGRINSNWPEWLPREYVWVYIYLVTPLANLNNNIVLSGVSNQLIDFLVQLLPTSITNLFGCIQPEAYLAEPSLNVSTAFIGPYSSYGMPGLYLYMFILVFVVLIVLYLPGRQRDIEFAIWMSSTYFLVLTVFANPSTYLITGYLLIISIAYRVTSLIEKKKSVR